MKETRQNGSCTPNKMKELLKNPYSFSKLRHITGLHLLWKVFLGEYCIKFRGNDFHSLSYPFLLKDPTKNFGPFIENNILSKHR